ncbi:MAG TPA: putative Ig domain-containing protein [Chthoniobacterales bacterium]
MIRPLSFALVLAAVLAGARGETPIRYDMVASIADVPASGGSSFGGTFFFQSGNRVVYRVVPSGGSESDPAASWNFWSTADGARAILPPASPPATYAYDSVRVTGLSPSGEVIGQASLGNPATKNAAFFWTVSAGSSVPTGLDAGFSSLDAIAPDHWTAGSTDSGTFEFIRWNSSTQAIDDITLPTGYPTGQIVGVSGSGDVLLYVTDASSHHRLAIWDGAASTIIGPAPDAGATFYPANCGIDSAGNVAMLVFTPGGNAVLYYIQATNRASWLAFTFTGPIDSSAYHLHLSSAGLASFDTTVNGVNTVNIVSASHAQQYTFTGYTSFLNSAGALIFGNQGAVYYWDAAAWSGSPAAVPLSLATQSGGLTLAGYNDDGNVLVTNTLNSTTSLAILAPAFPQPTQPLSVTLSPARRVFRLKVGQAVRMPLVKTQVSGPGLESGFTYSRQGRLPPGLRLRAGDGNLAGRPTAPKAVNVWVTASFAANGAQQQTAPTRVRIVVH